MKTVSVRQGFPRLTHKVSHITIQTPGTLYLTTSLALHLIGYRAPILRDGAWYLSGGYHPVDIGDIIGGEQRYEIMHKLGYRGCSVWLVRLCGDVPSYWALKILCADAPSFRYSTR